MNPPSNPPSDPTSDPTSAEPHQHPEAARPTERKDVPAARIPLGPEADPGTGDAGRLPLLPLFGLLGAVLGLVILGTVLDAPIAAGGGFVVVALIVVFGLSKNRRRRGG